MKPLVSTVFLALVAFSAAAQDPVTWSEEFNRPGLVGRVFAVGTYQGELVAGGQNFEARGSRPSHVARFDGERWLPLGAGVSGLVRGVAEYNGELVVAGEFGSAGGQPANSVAAWDGSEWRPLGEGLELSWWYVSTVFALEVFDGELYAGGQFDLADGQTALGIARWDGQQWHPVGGGINGPYEPKVLSLEADPVNGLLYVGGEFDTAGGVTTDNIAAWDGSQWHAVAGGISGPTSTGVHALQTFNGEICAGGNFHLADVPGARRIACSDGAQWYALGLGIPDWDISADVSSLAEFDGSLYVGGDFIEVDGEGGVPSRAVARWDGTQWHSVGGVAGTDLATTAIAMTVQGGRLVVGGEFKWAGTELDYGSAVVSWMIAGFDGSEWSAIGTGNGLLGGPSKILYYNGDLIGVGAFYTAGEELVGRIARFRNGRWEQFATFDRAVWDAVIYEGDLVVTGDFNQVNGQSIPHTARFDGTGWSGFGSGAGGDAIEVYNGQLYAGGLGLRRWNGSSWEALDTEIPGQIYDLHTHTDGRLYIGGYIGTPDGGYKNMAAWDGETMDNLDGGADDTVVVFYSRGDELLVGGGFDVIGGVPAERLAAFDGETWSEYGDGVGGLTVDALHEYNGRLYVAGNFTTYYGLPASFIIRDNNGEWEGIGEFNVYPRSFLDDPETGGLWMAGSFTRINNVPSHGMTRMFDGAPEMVFVGGFEAPARRVAH